MDQTMKRDDLSILRVVANPSDLPDDFARRVVQKARTIQRRRRFATRIGAGATVLMVGIVSLSYAPRWPLAHRAVDRPFSYYAAGYTQWGTGEANLRDASLDVVADDLVPQDSAARLWAEYNDSDWEYDPNWLEPVDSPAGQ
jgi:hypothetical protein